MLTNLKMRFLLAISKKISLCTMLEVCAHCYCSEFSNFSSFQSFLTNFPSIWLFLAKKCTKMAFFDAVWRTAAKNQNKMSQAKMLKIRSYLVSWGTVWSLLDRNKPGWCQFFVYWLWPIAGFDLFSSESILKQTGEHSPRYLVPNLSSVLVKEYQRMLHCSLPMYLYQSDSKKWIHS